MTSGEAIQHIVAQLRALAVDGVFPEIAQIDFAACEDNGASVMVYCHLTDEDVNGGMPVAGTFDLAEEFREHFESAVFAAAVLHKALHGTVDRLTAEIEGKASC